MRGLANFARALPVGACSIVLLTGLLAHPGTAKAQCVGDCTDDGMVSISDLILGVNIALGLQDPSVCPAFQNEEGQVTIAQLIKGVNNALIGCPPEATATSTATSVSTATSTSTATSVSTATSTSTPESTATRTGTFTVTATPTGTAAATVTATATPTGTAAATVTATETPAETATVTATETPAETATATATETEGPPTATATDTVPLPTATDTPIPPPTGTATDSPTPESTATVTDTPSPSSTATESATATETPTVTPTATEFPIGDSVAGSAAIVSVGLSSVQSLIGAIVAQATNQGPPVALVAGPLDVGVDEVQVTDIDPCPISGTTEQTCTEMGSGASKTIELTLEANQCVAAGPAGGSAEFTGRVHVDANPFFLNDCDPLAFASGFYEVGDLDPPATPLEILFRNNLMAQTLDVTALLNGSVSVSGIDATCLIGGLTVTLNGSIVSQVASGQTVKVEFDGTQMVMDQITYNEDCVPVAYRLKFNGMATFTLNPPPPALTNGIMMQTETFPVEFVNFFIIQNANTNPVTVTMMGSMTSYCFGGAVSLDTLVPVAVAAGQLCPNAGQIMVTGSGAVATVTYGQDMVTVDQAGMQQNYMSCLAPELLNCPQ